MKIAVVIESAIESGGGFNQSLSALLQIIKLSKSKFELEIVTLEESNLKSLQELGLLAIYLRPGFWDKILMLTSGSLFGRKLFNRYNKLGSFEKKLLKLKIDLVYFLSPSITALALRKLNFITTIWDVCHRDFPEFPEVREFDEGLLRDWLYKCLVSLSIRTLVDSSQLRDRLVHLYGLGSEKTLIMPFSPAPEITGDTGIDNKNSKINEIQKGFFLYPAQMWPHKNHVRIIEALKILSDKGEKRTVVFVGSDKGNCNYLKSYAKSKGVSEQVIFTGFVPAAELRQLYVECEAVVMPTYFGPTNIPPLEAWYMNKPLIYSAHLSEQVGDAALLVDPDDEFTLAKAMLDVLRPEIKVQLIERGQQRLKYFAEQREIAENQLLECLLKFKKRRLCWESFSNDLRD